MPSSEVGAAPTRRHGQACAVPPGSENRAEAHEGPPGTWEAPPAPPTTPARGDRITNPEAPGRAARPAGTKSDARGVSPREGAEAGREGRRGAGAAHGTAARGVPCRGT